MPARAASRELSFMTIGDWGHPNPAQRAVAAAMAKAAEQTSCRFVISVGDNFYEKGVSSIDDPQWRNTFEDVYSATSLQCPWYPVLGNHDHKGNAMAEIAYSVMSPRWAMAAPFYVHEVRDASGVSADFFFLDTEEIFEAHHGITQYLYREEAAEQISWLDQTLSASKAPWKFVVGHHPVFSGGYHGNTPELIAAIKPLLDRHGVKAYLNGHDHSMQHVVVDGVHYLTIGTGCESNVAAAISGTVFAKNSLGFLKAELSAAALQIEFVDEAGQTLHAASIAAVA